MSSRSSAFLDWLWDWIRLPNPELDQPNSPPRKSCETLPRRCFSMNRPGCSFEDTLRRWRQTTIAKRRRCPRSVSELYFY